MYDEYYVVVQSKSPTKTQHQMMMMMMTTISDEQGIWIADGDERHAGVEVKWNNYRESLTLRPRSTPAEPGPAE